LFKIIKPKNERRRLEEDRAETNLRRGSSEDESAGTLLHKKLLAG
jgi:hypothetical protein